MSTRHTYISRKVYKIVMIFLKTKHPKQRYIYAITGGKYLGELFCYIETTDSSHWFLSLPDMKIREVPIEKFDFGIKEKIIDIVKKIPSDVFKVCQAQYQKNKVLHPVG